MKRAEILLKLKKQINELNRLKKEYTYHDSINVTKKELVKVYNCIKNGGNLSDIQKIGLWNCTGFVKLPIPKGYSIKNYIEKISDNIESATDIENHYIPVNYLCSIIIKI